MRYHNKKIRTVVSDAAELDVLLVKQAVLNAVGSGCMVEYPSGYAIFTADNGEVFIQKTLAEAYITYTPHQLPASVDKFFEMFINEDSCDLGQLKFCVNPSDIGVRWTVLKRRLNIQDLLTERAVRHVVALLINEYYEAQKTSDLGAGASSQLTAE